MIKRKLIHMNCKHFNWGVNLSELDYAEGFCMIINWSSSRSSKFSGLLNLLQLRQLIITPLKSFSDRIFLDKHSLRLHDPCRLQNQILFLPTYQATNNRTRTSRYMKRCCQSACDYFSLYHIWARPISISKGRLSFDSSPIYTFRSMSSQFSLGSSGIPSILILLRRLWFSKDSILWQCG